MRLVTGKRVSVRRAKCLYLAGQTLTEMDNQMFPLTKALAARLGRPVVVFDLEHTGGRKETRGITEFAAYIVLPTGELQAYSSLVKPLKGVLFNAVVTGITGITPRTVAGAPAWSKVATDMVIPYRDALWVGYNSRASDMPILVEETARHGLTFDIPPCHLDLMRVTPAKAPLSAQLAQFVPDLDTAGAHRAAKDALMTLWLLEALLPVLSDEALDIAVQPDSKVARVARPEPLYQSAMELHVEWRSGRPAAPASVAVGRLLGRAVGGLISALR